MGCETQHSIPRAAAQLAARLGPHTGPAYFRHSSPSRGLLKEVPAAPAEMWPGSPEARPGRSIFEATPETRGLTVPEVPQWARVRSDVNCSVRREIGRAHV